jgi:hypothetical protein
MRLMNSVPIGKGVVVKVDSYPEFRYVSERRLRLKKVDGDPEFELCNRSPPPVV